MEITETLTKVKAKHQTSTGIHYIIMEAGKDGKLSLLTASVKDPDSENFIGSYAMTNEGTFSMNCKRQASPAAFADEAAEAIYLARELANL